MNKIELVCDDPKRGMQFCILLMGLSLTFAAMIAYGSHYEEVNSK